MKEYLELMVWCVGLVTAPMLFTQGIVKKQFNIEFSLKLHRLGENFSKWPDFIASEFCALFDYVFGMKAFSIRRIATSALSTFLAFSLVSVALVSLDPTKDLNDFWVRISIYWPEFYAYFAIILFVQTAIPDYFSLIETRFVIGRLAKKPRPFNIAKYLAIDLVATILIFFVFTFLVTWVWFYKFDTRGAWGDFQETITHLHSGFPKPGDSVNYTLYHSYYTTFITSIWLWVFSTSILILKILNATFLPAWNIVMRIMDVQRVPFLVLAFVSGLIIVVGFIVLMPFLLW